MGDLTPLPCPDYRVPIRTVTLTRDFEIQQTEVTQTMFRAEMGYNPSCHTAKPETSCVRPAVGDDTPVHHMSWHMAAAYCNALSRRAKLQTCYACSGTREQTRCSTASQFNLGGDIYRCRGYRLPTEAEWEYAYRAGTKTAFYSGPLTQCRHDPNADAIGWYVGNSTGPIDHTHPYPHPVGKKASNPLGLFDMAGNAVEWIHDAFTGAIHLTELTDPAPEQGSGRFWRGGGWGNNADLLRAGFRFEDGGFSANYQGATYLGVRCARSLQ